MFNLCKTVAGGATYNRDGPDSLEACMKPILSAALSFAMLSLIVFAFCFVLLAAAPEEKSPKPQYDSRGQLLRPDNYRDWMFLSSGYGMNYNLSPVSLYRLTNS